MAYSCMTFVMDFTGYNPILTVTCSRWTISIIVTFVVSDCGMGMWCVVVVVLAMADASVSVVNGTDDISLLVMAGVVSTIGCCGAWFGSFLKIWKGRNSYCWRKTLKCKATSNKICFHNIGIFQQRKLDVRIILS